MLLAIEQGNTNSLFAVHDGDHWIADPNAYETDKENRSVVEVK